MKTIKVYMSDDELIKVTPVSVKDGLSDLAFIKISASQDNSHININVDYINELITLLEQVKNDWVI